MTHASVFSGIGGPEVAAAMLGWRNLFHCEINPFGRKVLEYWFPESDSYADITKTDFKRYRGKVDVLTGGFPCQPFSYAGKRGGQTDDRYLWPEMLRVIDEVRPTWVVGENVAGITTMVESCEISEVGSETSLFQEGDGIHRFRSECTFTIERICRDLESKGYTVQPMLIPACAVGAPHRRDRVFIVAYSSCCGSESHTQDRRAEGDRSDELSQPSKRREQTEFHNGFSSVSRHSSDTYSCRQSASESKDQSSRQKDLSQSRGFSLSGPVGYGELRSTTDSDCDRGTEIHKHIQSQQSDGAVSFCNGRKRNVADTSCQQGERCGDDSKFRNEEQTQLRRSGSESITRMLPEERWEGFPSIAPVHRGNDGLPFDVDSLTIPFSKWRNESLKAYGNAIVPQVMYRIFQCIDRV